MTLAYYPDSATHVLFKNDHGILPESESPIHRDKSGENPPNSDISTSMIPVVQTIRSFRAVRHRWLDVYGGQKGGGWG